MSDIMDRELERRKIKVLERIAEALERISEAVGWPESPTVGPPEPIRVETKTCPVCDVEVTDHRFVAFNASGDRVHQLIPCHHSVIAMPSDD